MAEEQNKQQIQEILKRLEDLERKAIQYPQAQTEKENIKNGLFEGYFQSDQTIPTVAGDAPYLKLVWKNKIIYIPFYKE